MVFAASMMLMGVVLGPLNPHTYCGTVKQRLLFKFWLAQPLEESQTVIKTQGEIRVVSFKGTCVCQPMKGSTPLERATNDATTSTLDPRQIRRRCFRRGASAICDLFPIKAIVSPLE